MSSEIKIIGNVRKPSIYDPDLAQKIIEEERRRIEEKTKRRKTVVIEKNPKSKENKAKAADKIPDVITNLAVSYNNIQFEPTAFYENGSNDKKLFYFNDSLDRIKKANYERHARPQEIYGLIIDSLEGKISNTPLQSVYDDMFKSYGEFMSLAWERKGNMLIAYLDPEGLVWNANNYVKKSFKFARKQEFNIAGKDSSQWIDLKEFDDEFVEWHYTKKFSELPKIMQKGNNRAQVYLPSDGSIWPLGRGDGNYDVAGYSYGGRASRWVRKKFP